MSTFTDEVKEILTALQQLENRAGSYPLTADDAYQCAHLLATAAGNMGRITAAVRGALLPTISGQNPTANKTATANATNAADLLLAVSRDLDNVYTQGGDATYYLREMAREPGFALRPKAMVTR